MKKKNKNKKKIKNVASYSNVGKDEITQNNKTNSAADLFEQR